MGQIDFVIGGAMIGGFALAAAPADYRVTGVKTFIVEPDGVAEPPPVLDDQRVVQPELCRDVLADARRGINEEVVRAHPASAASRAWPERPSGGRDRSQPGRSVRPGR